MTIGLTAPTDIGLARRYRQQGWWSTVALRFGLEAIADADGERVAVIDNDRTWTYAELREFVEGSIGSLLKAGVESGDAVVIVAPISGAALAAVLATLRADGVVVVLDRRSGALDVAHAVRSSGSRVVVVPDELRRALGVDDHDVVVLDLASLDQGTPVDDWSEPDEHAARLVIFTSGTTKSPKGVVHTLETFGAGIRNFADPLEFMDDDRLFLASPIASVTGMSQVLLAVRGASIVLEDRFDARRSTDRVEAHGATIVGGAPIIPQTILREYLRRERQPSALRTVAVGGAMIPRELMDLAKERFGIEPVRMYGSAEVPVHTASSPEDSIEDRLADDGRPRPGCEYRLGAAIAEGHELLVRGPNLFQGYLYDEDNVGVFEDDWVRSGDVVREVSGRRIRVLGRLKETAVRKGLKISLAEVDAASAGIPGAIESAAYCVPDEETGERVALALHTSEGTDLSYEEVVRLLHDSGLARSKLPEEIVVWEGALPRNPSGKIVRSELVAAGTSRRRLLAPRLRVSVDQGGPMATEVEAGLTATVWKVVKNTGDHVDEGDVIAILESMKMEIPIEAPTAGICRVLVVEGDTVTDETVLAVIE